MGHLLMGASYAQFGVQGNPTAIHNPRLYTDPRPRPWDLGLLFNRDKRLAERVRRALAGLGEAYVVEYNVPYCVCDESDYTIPVHGEGRGIPNMLLEIRNDHISDTPNALRMAEYLARAIQSMPAL